MKEMKAEIKDIIDCILKYDENDRLENKGRFFDVIQRDLRKAMEQPEQPREPEKEEQWISTQDSLPTDGCEVIGFHKNWINEDFNPNGTRICGYNDGIHWIIARWNPSHDCWMTDYTDDDDCQSEVPTHWMPIKQNPLIKK